MIHIIGGVYQETCLHPSWNEIFGSGGRAASAIAKIGGQAALHSHIAKDFELPIQTRAALEGFNIKNHKSSSDKIEPIYFEYNHALSTPYFPLVTEQNKCIKLSEDMVIQFGMMECDVTVNAEYAVYDPQNVRAPKPFNASGSKAKNLAIVLNIYEANVFCSKENQEPSKLVKQISDKFNAAVVIIKMGALGALVYEKNTVSHVPAFKTENVWKIGSGDNFVAQFGFQWMEKRRSVTEAALLASKATAFYCSNRGFPSEDQLNNYDVKEIKPSKRYLKGYKPTVYLAGPFFNLNQLWLVNQARMNLISMGLNVFSPYHNVGRGSADDVVEKDIEGIKNCDILWAIGDGLDSGTIFEIGYAKAINKPVIIYSETLSEQDIKMMEGTNCELCNDYVTSIYRTLWAACEL